MFIHISGKTIDTSAHPQTLTSADGKSTPLTLYDIILSAKSQDGTVPKLHSPCGGHLKCRKCTVCAVIREDAYDELVSGDWASFHRQLTESERLRFLNAMHVPPDLHQRTIVDLACAMPVSPFITDLYLPDPEEISGASTDNELLPDEEIKPVVLSIKATLTRPTVENPIDTYTNLYNAIFKGNNPVTAADFGYSDTDYTVICDISDQLVASTAEKLRSLTDNSLTVVAAITCAPLKQRGSKPVIQLTAAVDLSITGTAPIGAAIDLGTTTVALSLWNLKTGKQLASRVITNPQRNFGADVISRMSYAAEHGAALLQETIHTAIRDSILSMLSEISPSESAESHLNDILYTIVAGNSVMEHMFCGKSTDSISKAPFFMTDSFGYAVPAKDLCKSIFCHPDAPVYLALLAASYIGGDITIGLAYLMQAYKGAKNGHSLFLDLGTNGEICVISNAVDSSNSNKAKFLLAATAAGPALEGAHIKMGMSAISGAISRVKIPNDKSGEFAISSISDALPIGICGSGLIDAISCALDTGLITSYGRICDDGEPEDEEYSDLYQIFEHKISENDDGKLQIALTDTVFLHESDIRQVQTAKAAIAAGSQTLLSAANLTDADLDHVYLAGSFGGGIDPKTSARIGLLPDVSPEIITAVGNTSAKGAAGFLLYPSIRRSLNEILAQSVYKELSGSPEFTELYVDNMVFGSLE